MHKILIINAAGLVGGDVAMLLLGLPYLTPDQFTIYSATVPRGEIYEIVRELPNTRIIPMELGGKEAQLSGTNQLQRIIQAVIAIIRITLLVRRENIEVIYTMDRTVGMVISYFVSLLSGRILVLNAQIWHYLTTSLIHRLVIKHATRITVSSEKMRQIFLPYVKEPGRLKVIPNAIVMEKYDPTIDGKAIRQQLGIPQDAPVVVLAGRLTPYKGQEDFIRAAAIVLKKYPNAYFLMAGRENVPGYQATLEQMIAQLKVGERVKLIGFCDNIPALYAGSSVVTMPSHEEAFGLVALEAMAMKKPVVATRAGGVPEFLPDGEAGLLIEPLDYEGLAKAITQLLDEPQMARKMGENGREIAENGYNDHVYGTQIADLFREVISLNGKKIEYQPLTNQR